MKQIFMVTLDIEKAIKISSVVDWMKEKIVGTKITEVSIENTDLIFYGTLNSYLGEIIIVSTEAVSINELKHIFTPHPHFVHELTFKIRF